MRLMNIEGTILVGEVVCLVFLWFTSIGWTIALTQAQCEKTNPNKAYFIAGANFMYHELEKRGRLK